MIDLKAMYRHIYRIRLDESVLCGGISQEDRLWLYEIPGRYGHIFVWDIDRLGAHCDHPRMIPRLLALPGIRVQQRGDRVVNVSFDPALFDQVAEIIQPLKRRRLSPERKAAAIERVRAWRWEKGRAQRPRPSPDG